MVLITGWVADSAGELANGRIEFTQAVRFDNGTMQITGTTATAQVFEGRLRNLNGGDFEMPINPEGTAVRVTEILGGRTFEWWTAIPDSDQVEYRSLEPMESSDIPESVFGPPPWLEEVRQLRDETLLEISEGKAIAEALGGLPGIQEALRVATEQADAADSAASIAVAAAERAAAKAGGRTWVGSEEPAPGVFYRRAEDGSVAKYDADRLVTTGYFPSTGIEGSGSWQEIRRNLAHSPIDTATRTAWRSSSSSTSAVEISTEQVLPGRTHSAKCTLREGWTSTPGIFQSTPANGGPASSGNTAPGERVGCWIWLETGRTLRFTIAEVTPGGNIAGSRMTALVIQGTGGWQWVEGVTTVAKTNAANALSAWPYALASDNGGGSPIFSWWVSDPLNQPDAMPGAPFTGSTAAGSIDPDMRQRWTGEENNSPSVMEGQLIAGLSPVPATWTAVGILSSLNGRPSVRVITLREGSTARDRFNIPVGTVRESGTWMARAFNPNSSLGYSGLGVGDPLRRSNLAMPGQEVLIRHQWGGSSSNPSLTSTYNAYLYGTGTPGESVHFQDIGLYDGLYAGEPFSPTTLDDRENDVWLDISDDKAIFKIWQKGVGWVNAAGLDLTDLTNRVKGVENNLITKASIAYVDDRIQGISNIAAAGGGALPPVDFDIRKLAAPTGTKQTVPTHLSPNGGQVVHPSVVFFPEPWNGYRYWMAITPYPGGSDAHEDPNIVASIDGIKWEVPAGLTNPLDDAPGSPQYNSDTDLVFADGKLWCFWRYLDTNAGAASENIYVSSSENGSTWTSKQLVYRTNMTTRRLVSPSLMFEGGRWIMYAVDIVNSPFKLIRMETRGGSPLSGQWTNLTTCSLSAASGRDLWHIEIRRVGGRLYGILNDCIAGQSGASGDLYMISSLDGVNFERASNTLIPKVLDGQHTALYRASFIPEFVDGVLGFRIWYSAWVVGPPHVWNLFYTFAQVPVEGSGGSSSTQLIQSGMRTHSNAIANGGAATLNFTFPTRYKAAPEVVVSVDGGRLNAAVTTVSATGFTVILNNWSGANASQSQGFNVRYIAVGERQ